MKYGIGWERRKELRRERGQGRVEEEMRGGLKQ